jgi:hypothetical protein
MDESNSCQGPPSTRLLLARFGESDREAFFRRGAIRYVTTIDHTTVDHLHLEFMATHHTALSNAISALSSRWASLPCHRSGVHRPTGLGVGLGHPGSPGSPPPPGQHGPCDAVGHDQPPCEPGVGPGERAATPDTERGDCRRRVQVLPSIKASYARSDKPHNVEGEYSCRMTLEKYPRVFSGPVS